AESSGKSLDRSANPAFNSARTVVCGKTRNVPDANRGDAVHYKHETVETLGQKLRDGTTTAQQQADRARQAAARAEPVFITTVNDDTAAKTSDEHFQSHTPRSALEGIPIAVKDVIATAGVRTTMGSRFFSDHVPSEDAQIVKQLKAAGANIVGKSNTHEFSFGIRGDSTAFGVVPNPHDETRIAGGSSSGSAAAVARGIVPLAVGTDTAGSIRVPAALCGAVGFKPTYDLLDTTGIFPLAPSFDTAGFLGTTVQDIIVAMAAVGVESISDLSESGVDLQFRTLRGNPGLSSGLPPEETEQRVPDLLQAPAVAHPHSEGRPAACRGVFGPIRSRRASLVHHPCLQADWASEQCRPLTYSRLQEGAGFTDEQAQQAPPAIREIGEPYRAEFGFV